MQPNPDCTDLKCKELQYLYLQNPEKSRRKVEKKELEKKLVSENEWGITLDEEVSES